MYRVIVSLVHILPASVVLHFADIFNGKMMMNFLLLNQGLKRVASVVVTALIATTVLRRRRMTRPPMALCGK
jgi:hypothetical protein